MHSVVHLVGIFGSTAITFHIATSVPLHESDLRMCTEYELMHELLLRMYLINLILAKILCSF